MSIKISNAPCSWGVDYADAKDNPGWQKFLEEIAEAGYQYTELGPFGYLPTITEKIRLELDKLNLKIIGGFVFDNLHISNQHSQIKEKIINTFKLLNAWILHPRKHIWIFELWILHARELIWIFGSSDLTYPKTYWDL